MNNEENERIYQDRAMKKLKLLKTKRINLIDKVELISKVIVPSLRYIMNTTMFSQVVITSLNEEITTLIKYSVPMSKNTIDYQFWASKRDYGLRVPE